MLKLLTYPAYYIAFLFVEVSTGKFVFTANFSDNIFYLFPGFMTSRDTYVLYLRFKNEN